MRAVRGGDADRHGAAADGDHPADRRAVLRAEQPPDGCADCGGNDGSERRPVRPADRATSDRDRRTTNHRTADRHHVATNGNSGPKRHGHCGPDRDEYRRAGAADRAADLRPNRHPATTPTECARLDGQ